MLPLPKHKQNNRYSKNAEAVKNVLADFFCGPGQVPSIYYFEVWNNKKMYLYQ